METLDQFRPTKSKYLVITADYIIPTIIFLGIMFFGYLALYSPVFRITSISCELDFSPCENGAVLSELDKLRGENIFTLDTSVIKARLTSGDFTIREALVSRALPGSLSVQLQSVYPVVALQIAGDPTWVVLDSDLRVIATRQEDANVPTVIVPGPLTVIVGQSPADPLIIASLKLAIHLASELFSIKSLALIDGDTIELTLDDGKKALFTPKKDTGEQLRLLQVILEGATITKEIRIIDVRFNRPVLR